MAKRRKRRRRRRSRRGFSFGRIDFNPEIKRGVLAIFLFALAGLSLLSFFQLAGLAGTFWEAFLAVGFGKTRFVIPVVLIIIGYLIEKEGEYNYTLMHFIGAALFFLAINAMFHLGFPARDLIDEALQGGGGGILGLALAWPLKQFVGYWAGMIILIALLVVALLFLFNMSLANLVETHRLVLAHLGWIGNSIVGLARLIRKPQGGYQSADEGDVDDDIGFERRALSATDDEDADFEDELEEDDEPTSDDTDQQEQPSSQKPKAAPKPKKPFILPSPNLLYTSKSKPSAGDIKANGVIIKETLENFGINVSLGEVQVGPTVTQYTLKPSKGVKLNRITTLHNDLALALAAHPIRIEAPIPGKSLVGVEVPNQRIAMVTLRELLEHKEFKGKKDSLMFAAGKDVSGNPMIADISKMPHLLIAGATGSGKTVGIHSLIISLLYQHTPQTLRFIMVDPKRVELPAYNGIPHLLTPVITDKNKTIAAIKWAITEMERRFDLLSQNKSRDIGSYNKKNREKLPYIVFVIDELADLMVTSGAEVEAGIVRLAQMARAVGIHLVIATQRPSVDVITGLMKANIPARAAFSVGSLMDSRVILDTSGAEKLLGRGDMLFLTADISKPKRLQGAFISEEEIHRIADFLKDQDAPSYEDFEKTGGGSATVFGGGSADRDALFEQARQMVIESGKASASFLQRRLRVGYARAARILDELEDADVVGPAVGSKAREVLMSPDDLDMVDDSAGYQDIPVPDRSAPEPEETLFPEDEEVQEQTEQQEEYNDEEGEDDYLEGQEGDYLEE